MATETEQEERVEPLKSFSTQVEEAQPVEIDDELYKIFGRGHIGKSEEIKLMTLFKKHERAQRKFDKAQMDKDVARAAEEMRNVRIEIITTFSEIPSEVAEKVALPDQASLLDIIATEMGLTADEEEEEA